MNQKMADLHEQELYNKYMEHYRFAEGYWMGSDMTNVDLGVWFRMYNIARAITVASSNYAPSPILTLRGARFNSLMTLAQKYTLANRESQKG